MPYRVSCKRTLTKSISIGKTCQFYWLQPQKKTAGNGFGFGVGKVGRTSRKKAKPYVDLSRLSHLPEFVLQWPLLEALAPEPDGFPAVHSPAALTSGVPGNLPLSHRGPFLVRAPGPLSVPETKTIPLWLLSHLESVSPPRLCSKPCLMLQCSPLHVAPPQLRYSLALTPSIAPR